MTALPAPASRRLHGFGYTCVDCSGWVAVWEDPEGVWESCDCAGGYMPAAPDGWRLEGVVTVDTADGSLLIVHGPPSYGSTVSGGGDRREADAALARHGYRRGRWHATADGLRAYVFARDWSLAP